MLHLGHELLNTSRSAGVRLAQSCNDLLLDELCLLRRVLSALRQTDEVQTDPCELFGRRGRAAAMAAMLAVVVPGTVLVVEVVLAELVANGCVVRSLFEECFCLAEFLRVSPHVMSNQALGNAELVLKLLSLLFEL